MEITAVRIIFMILGTILACLTSILVSRYHLWHKIFFKFFTWLKRLMQHTEVKYVKHNGYNFCYLTRGKPGPQPSMLMLHGFSLNKDMWLEILKYTPKEIHVICLDLPGHGATTRLLGDNYAAEEQAKRVHEFVKCVGLDKKPFHLIGFSVGGMIAGVYAALYPTEIRCLSLLCPAGVQYESGYEFIKHFRELEKSISVENSSLISMTERQGEELLKLGLYHPSIFQLQLLKGYLDDDRPQRMFFIKNFLDLTSEESRYSLQENASKIRAPTEIIWGKNDKVLDASGADILAKLIPNCKVHILDKCGHFISIDRPQKAADLIMEFNNSVCETKKNN